MTTKLSLAPSRKVDKSFWIKAKFYIAHLLLSWCTRSWQFAIGLFFVILSPNENLRLTSISQFLLLLVVMFFIPLVGKWIDVTKRITAMRVSILMDSTIVCLICITLYTVSAVWDKDGVTSFTLSLLFLGVALCCLQGLADNAIAITLQRDWVIVLCDAGHADLTTLNAVMKQIDMVCNVLAPILTGYLMTSVGIQTTSIVLASTFATTAVITCVLLNSVYNQEVSLSRPKIIIDYSEIAAIIENTGSKCGYGQAPTDRDENANCSSSTLSNEIKLQSYGSIDITSPENILSVTKSGSCANLNVCSMFLDGFKTYCSYPVRWAALSLAMLYLTTLSFHFATSGYLLLHGMSETAIAIATALSSISGFLGTYVFLYLKNTVGLERGALCGILIQLGSITISLVALWLPFAESDHAFSCAKMGVGDSENCLGFATLTMFCFGIIVSRAGLWTFDLSVVQMIQESVPPAVRGRFNGFQHALQSAFELKQIILVIIFPEVSTYRWLALVSYLSVFSAFFMYLYYYYQNKRKEEKDKGQFRQQWLTNSSSGRGMTSITTKQLHHI